MTAAWSDNWLLPGPATPLATVNCSIGNVDMIRSNPAWGCIPLFLVDQWVGGSSKTEGSRSENPSMRPNSPGWRRKCWVIGDFGRGGSDERSQSPRFASNPMITGDFARWAFTHPPSASKASSL